MALGTFRAGLSSSAKAFWKCFHGYPHTYVSKVFNSKSSQGTGEIPQSVKCLALKQVDLSPHTGTQVV